jgi:hypothetical protein
MNITPNEFLRMCDEVRMEGLRVPNSLIVRALSDKTLEVRNVATILATRRNIQIVGDK